jgi:hypothetical protein
MRHCVRCTKTKKSVAVWSRSSRYREKHRHTNELLYMINAEIEEIFFEELGEIGNTNNSRERRMRILILQL